MYAIEQMWLTWGTQRKWAYVHVSYVYAPLSFVSQPQVFSHACVLATFICRSLSVASVDHICNHIYVLTSLLGAAPFNRVQYKDLEPVTLYLVSSKSEYEC